MQLSKSSTELLVAIKEEWNRAEGDIKTAELVVSKIVFPAIKELRYAGRRIVDAIQLASVNGDEQKIKALLDDACFDCHRARHDAIDAATAKIAADLDIMVTKLGYDSILPVYSDFPKLWCDLQRVREQISISRRDRDKREAIYSTIESIDFPALVAFFNDMRASEKLMKALAKRNRWKDIVGNLGFIIGFLGLILSGVTFIWR